MDQREPSQCPTEVTHSSPMPTHYLTIEIEIRKSSPKT
jgi:hypothetical protein